MNTATLGYDTYYLVPVGYVVENPYKDPANIPKWTGHYFIGWENIYNKDVIINEYGDVIVDENYTSVFFEAQYAAYKYTVRFDANGGEGTMADQTHTYDSSLSLTANKFKKEGCTFAGWDTEIPSKMPAKDMKITALWTANNYLVAFDANSGEGTMADQEMAYDTPANLTPNSFTKKNYEFVGWSADSTATSPEYTDGQKVVNLSTGDKVTLYAVWSKNAVTVTASAGKGGNVNPTEANVMIGGDIDITITPANERYEISEVAVNGSVMDLSALTESGDSKVLSLTGITEDTEVSVSFKAEPIVGRPDVEFTDKDRVYKVNEKIEFKAIGFWQTKADRIEGDEYYVPECWHHAEPSGDWGGTDDSSYDYSASFVQSKAGTYILKVEFRKYVYDGTAWTDSGIVTVETEYTVMGEVLGESDTPDTGDNGISVMVMLNIMLVSAFGLIACVRWHKRRKNSI